MDYLDRMEAKKTGEDDKFVYYSYGHVAAVKKMTGKLKISNCDLPSVTTVQLEDGFKTRANEMRIAGLIMMRFMDEKVWPEEIKLC